MSCICTSSGHLETLNDILHFLQQFQRSVGHSAIGSFFPLLTSHVNQIEPRVQDTQRGHKFSEFGSQLMYHHTIVWSPKKCENIRKIWKIWKKIEKKVEKKFRLRYWYQNWALVSVPDIPNLGFTLPISEVMLTTQAYPCKQQQHSKLLQWP